MRSFQLLVVEDDEGALRQLVLLLKESLPGSEIAAAQSVQEARGLIAKAIEHDIPYGLAILDFKLPQVGGGNDDVDETLCRTLGDLMPTCIVGHITGYGGDARIVAHIGREHTGRTLGFFLDKKQPNFGRELIKRTKEALYGVWIENEARDLFTQERTPPGPRAAAPRPAGSATSRTMELSLELAHIWPDLSRATQEYVKRFFAVEDSEHGGVSVVKR